MALVDMKHMSRNWVVGTIVMLLVACCGVGGLWYEEVRRDRREAAICLLGCDKSSANSKTREAALKYKATVDGVRNVFDSQGVGGLGTFRDAWGRKLASVEAGQFGLMKSLGLNPKDNEDDILIDYSSSHLTIRYDFDGTLFEYDEEWD